MPLSAQASKPPPSQKSLGHPSVNEVQDWNLFVEYKWPKPRLPTYYTIFEFKFILFLWALILRWLSRIFGRTIFLHAAFLAVSRHPGDAGSVGVVWELGTTTGDDNKGAAIENITSYFSHEKASQVPAGWACLVPDNDLEFFHELREYSKVGTIRASMAEVNKIVQPVLQDWDGTEYNKASHNCELLAKALIARLDDRFKFSDGSNYWAFLVPFVVLIVPVTLVCWWEFSPAHTRERRFSFLYFILTVYFSIIGFYCLLKGSNWSLDFLPTYIRQQRHNNQTDRNFLIRLGHLLSTSSLFLIILFSIITGTVTLTLHKGAVTYAWQDYKKSWRDILGAYWHIVPELWELAYDIFAYKLPAVQPYSPTTGFSLPQTT